LSPPGAGGGRRTRVGLGCSATVTLGLYDPSGLVLIAAGSAHVVVDADTFADTFNVGVVISSHDGLSLDWPFMLQVICHPLTIGS
jgi:hypothetical protein